MILLYEDKQLLKPIEGGVLYENVTYFIKLKDHDPKLIEREIKSGRCSQFIDWHPSNLVGKVTFSDIAGFVKLFGVEYDIKSTKFLEHLDGHNQFHYLLQDISSYSSTLIFSPAAPSSVSSTINPRKLTSNVFYIYKYLSNHLLCDGRDSFQQYLDIILGNPHFSQRVAPAYVPTFSAKKFNYSTLQKMAARVMDSDLIPANHELCHCHIVSKLPTTPSGQIIIPKQLYSNINVISYDTPENRFIKYFLGWCHEIYLFVLKKYGHFYEIGEECARSLAIIRRYLNHPFFSSIGAFSYLPTTSSVLSSRVGYKELYRHYIQCRNQPKFFENYLTDMFLGIRNISQLYEYWVFFQIAKELMGSEATLEIVNSFVENNNLKYGLKISRNNMTLYYNKTYHHLPSESYNFHFRPDISLEVHTNGKIIRFFFDAKYSNSKLPSSDEGLTAIYKNSNVVKMLSYLEAITYSEFAVIVYPGSEFAFYTKPFSTRSNFEPNPALLNTFTGVGAIPLSPNHEISYSLFSTFMKRFKEHLFDTEIAQEHKAS